MTNTQTSKLHPEMLKMFNSPIYRRKVKRAVQAIKTLHGMNHGKLPGKSDSFKPDNSTAHFFSQLTEAGMERSRGKQ